MADKKFIFTLIIISGIIYSAWAFGNVNTIQLLPDFITEQKETCNLAEATILNESNSNVTEVIPETTDASEAGNAGDTVTSVDVNVTTTNSTLLNNSTNSTNNIPSSSNENGSGSSSSYIDNSHITHGGTPMQDSPSSKSSYDNGYTESKQPEQIRNGGTPMSE